MSSEAPENSQQATQPGAAGESQNGALSQQQSQQQPQSQSQQPQVEEEEQDAVAPPPMEPRMPTRKDVSLRELLSKMDDNAPIVSLPLPAHQTNHTLKPDREKKKSSFTNGKM